MTLLPTGTVTFLFTDIEGSTRLWQAHPDDMQIALQQHHRILQKTIIGNGGRVFQIIGDAFCAAFGRAPDALAAAVMAQRELHAEPWDRTGPLKVRMGLHSGEAETRQGQYVSSLTLVRVQRVMAAGHGGQTLISGSTAELIGNQLPLGAFLVDQGKRRLRGLIQPEQLYQVNAGDLPSSFPPLNVLAPEDGQSDRGAILERLVKGKLVARRKEFQQLCRHWKHALQARGHLVLLAGEPGIGKTRLAFEMISQAHKDGAFIMHGGCYESEATTPYMPLVEALREWVRGQKSKGLSARLGDTANELVKLAPEIETKLGEVKPNPPLAPDEERLRLFDSMARFLRTLAAPSGLLLFVDDLHWADSGTLSLLHYLLRHLKNDRILVLGAYRDMQQGRMKALSSALVDWNREHLVSHVSVGRFGSEDTVTMLTTLLGDAAIAAEISHLIFKETEGNPFFIEEIVKTMIEQGQIYRSADLWSYQKNNAMEIPQSVKEALSRRLNRLDTSCVEVLTKAAGLGKQFEFGELMAVTEADEDSALDALDEAVAAQLIVSVGDEGFVFTHDKIREVLIMELNPIRRRRLHQRIGSGLERLHADSLNKHKSALAFHFTLSGDWTKSLKYSLGAARNAEEVFGHDEAITYLQQARAAAEKLELQEDIAIIDETMGKVYNRRGNLKLAVDALERSLAGTPGLTRRAEIKAHLGSVYGVVGDPRGLPYLREAASELDPHLQTNELANATAQLGRYHHYHAEHIIAIDYLEKARILAESTNDPMTLQTVYGYLAGVYQHMAQLDKSDRWAQASIELGERESHMLARAMGHEFLAENAIGRSDWEKALKQTKQNRRLAKKMGALLRQAWSGHPHTLALWYQGHLAQALQAVQEALELSQSLGETRLATWLEPILAIVATDMGDNQLAERYAERGVQAGKSLGQVALHSWGLHGKGYQHLQRHNWSQALRYYEQALKLWYPTTNRYVALHTLANAAEANLGVGRVGKALELLEDAAVLARSAPSPQLGAMARRVQAQAFTKLGRLSEAADGFDSAIVTLEQLGSRLELGRAYFHRAKMWSLQGPSDQARHDAEQALRIFAECGAKVDKERTQSFMG